MKKNILSTIILGIVIIITTTKSYAGSFDTSYAAILQSKIEQLKSTYNLVGISAAALVPGQGLWMGTSGISSSDSDNVTTDMIFGAGSVTKNFIAAIILQLEEADSLSLNDSIGNWLPVYLNINNSITLRQLLDHSSGIYNVTENAVFTSHINEDLNRLWTIEEVLSGGYVLTPYFSPGTSFRYSNTNYMILGLIIRKIMGTNLSTQLHSRFFSPYYLNESFLETQDTITHPYSHNWADLGWSSIVDAFFLPKTSIYSATMGAGGISTRPQNLVRWAELLFTGKIINQNSLQQMLTFRPVNFGGANGYGLGTMRYQVSGRSCYGHGGNIWGYTTVMIFDPVEKISIALMMNRDLNGTAPGIAFMNTAIQNNPVSIHTISKQIPEKFLLYQNYPNPFNPSTDIKFEIKNKEYTTLSVMNILGQEIKTLYEGILPAGIYSYNWEATNETSGIYFYKLKTANYTEVKKMILLR